jgi:hypothetical protein
MKLSLCLLILLASGTAFTAEVATAPEVLARYLKLPQPEEDRLGEARQRRWAVLAELKGMPDTAVGAIVLAWPEVKDPRQRMELAEALGFFPGRESSAKLCELLDDPDATVRRQAIGCLRLMARRVDRFGGQRQQRGAEFAPQVDGLVPHLIRAAADTPAMNREAALFALADTLDPLAVAELRKKVNDENERVRFTAACLLTEFQDASGLGELKKAVERYRGQDPAARDGFGDSFAVERLLASLERITGKSFGVLPRLNPVLNSNSFSAEASQRRYKELLEAWAAWWAWKPPGR